MILGWVVSTQAFAAFSLSITPAVTRNDINFGQVKEGDVLTQEAELKVTNDTGVRYRILHVVLETLKNAQDDSFPADSIKLFLRSASRGTMKVEAPTPLQAQTVELYVSDDAGTADTMTLAYTLFVPKHINGGEYRGKITFNLEPLTASSNAPLRSVTVDISFDLKTIFGLELSSDSGRGKLGFGKVKPGVSEQVTQMTLETFSNLGREYSIYQSLADPLVNNQSGQSLPSELFTAVFSGARQGTLSSSAKLTQDPALVYQSDPMGSSDRFAAIYALAHLETLPAGLYQGMILFNVETPVALPASVQTSYSLPVTLEIENIFDFIVTPEIGNSLQFKESKPGEVTEQKIVIQVRSNAGQPYQLQQIRTEPFSSDSGEIIPEENFEILAQGGSSGELAIMHFQPVKIGTTILYTSNPKGAGDSVTLVYRFSVPKEARGGNYRTHLSFALSLI